MERQQGEVDHLRAFVLQLITQQQNDSSSELTEEQKARHREMKQYLAETADV